MSGSVALTFAPGKTSVPLLVNHDDTRAVGVVHTLTRFEDTDCPWLGAIAEIHDRPLWLRKNETKVSFSYKPAGTSHDVFGCTIVRRGLVSEVSLRSPDQEPAEPLARVLTLRPAEQTTASRGGGEVNHTAPGTVLRRYFPSEITIR